VASFTDSFKPCFLPSKGRVWRLSASYGDHFFKNYNLILDMAFFVSDCITVKGNILAAANSAHSSSPESGAWWQSQAALAAWIA